MPSTAPRASLRPRLGRKVRCSESRRSARAQQGQRRIAQPGLAAGHAGIGRGAALHADQHVVGQLGAVRHVGAVADEAAVADHRRAHGHPAPVDFLVAQHHAVGDEAVAAQRQHVRHDAHGGRDLGARADLGAQQAVPGAGVDRGVQPVQHAQAGFLDLVGQPAPQVDLAIDRPASAAQARQQRPAQQGRDQDGQHQQQRALAGSASNR